MHKKLTMFIYHVEWRWENEGLFSFIFQPSDLLKYFNIKMHYFVNYKTINKINLYLAADYIKYSSQFCAL